MRPARQSPGGCKMAGRAVPAPRSSPASLPPIVPCRTGPSPGWCAGPASGRACPRWAPTGSPHGRDADAAGRRHPDRGRASAAAAQPGRHQPLCQGRPGRPVGRHPAVARWCGMSALRQSLSDYLALRRSVGYKLEDAARILASFVAFAERAGAGTITTELALSWAAQPQQASPIWLAHRLSAVRGFAAYLHALDPATEIPPADLLTAPGYQPAPPYLYSDADVAALLAAARRLTPPLWAATSETLLGLLATTGCFSAGHPLLRM